MSGLFETDGPATTRTSTGSRFRVSNIPLEFSGFNCIYETPIYGLKIEFAAIFIGEKFALKQKKYDRTIQAEVCIAVVLEKGRLKTAIRERLPSHPQSDVDNMITDLYELIVEWVNSDVMRYYEFNKSEAPAHIYEVEPRLFNDAMWNAPKDKTPGPELIKTLQATLVF